MDSFEPYDHVSPGEADIPDGVYRVVGTDEDGVTLLRVADARGRRLNTGEVRRVAREAVATFESAENPDGNYSLQKGLASAVEMAYWSLRSFLQQLASNPLPTSVGLALVLVGVYGDRLVSLPDIVFSGAILVGSLGVAYVGSGRVE